MTAIDTALLFFAFGYLGGIFSSTPLGPINLWVLDHRLEQRSAHLLHFVAGVIAADVAAAAVAAWGYYTFLNEGLAPKLIAACGGALLVALGVGTLLGARRAVPDLPRTRWHAGGRPARAFALGVLLCGANPAFLGFWVFALSILNEALEISPEATQLSLSLFLLGIVLGDATWFRLLVRLADWGVDFLQPELRRRLRQAVGAAMAGLGLVALVGLTRA